MHRLPQAKFLKQFREGLFFPGGGIFWQRVEGGLRGRAQGQIRDYFRGNSRRGGQLFYTVVQNIHKMDISVVRRIKRAELRLDLSIVVALGGHIVEMVTGAQQTPRMHE